MQDRLTIAIDIDDVLADNAAGFVKFSNEHYGTNLTVEDYDEHWAEVWKVDYDEVAKRADDFHHSGVFASYTPNEHAKSVLSRLSERFNLIIVTSRRLQVRNDTVKWIATHYPGIFQDNHIYFANIWDEIDKTSIQKTKAGLVKELGASFLIDDQLKHCVATAEAGLTGLLFGNYCWNRAEKLHNNVIRVDDWAAVEDYFSHVK